MSGATGSAASAAHIERSALKEWSVLVEAMARGEIIAMVRKGGIREHRGGFAVRHQRFVLYPTYFHENAPGIAPRFAGVLAAGERPAAGVIRIDCMCDVAAVWHVTELDRLHAIEHEHGLAWPAVESRFFYRDRPGVHVIAVRVSRLERACEVPERRRYGGCVSWVELDDDVSVAGAAAVMSDQEFGGRVGRMKEALGTELPGVEL